MLIKIDCIWKHYKNINKKNTSTWQFSDNLGFCLSPRQTNLSQLKEIPALFSKVIRPDVPDTWDHVTARAAQNVHPRKLIITAGIRSARYVFKFQVVCNKHCWHIKEGTVFLLTWTEKKDEGCHDLMWGRLCLQRRSEWGGRLTVSSPGSLSSVGFTGLGGRHSGQHGDEFWWDQSKYEIMKLMRCSDIDIV